MWSRVVGMPIGVDDKDKPRFLPFNQNVEVEESISRDIIDALISKNHNIIKTEYPHGGGQIISIDWKEGKLSLIHI